MVKEKEIDKTRRINRLVRRNSIDVNWENAIKVFKNSEKEIRKKSKEKNLEDKFVNVYKLKESYLLPPVGTGELFGEDVKVYKYFSIREKNWRIKLGQIKNKKITCLFVAKV